MLVSTFEREITIAKMPQFGAVSVGEGDADSLPVQRREVHTHSLPVAPIHNVQPMVPARIVVRQHKKKAVVTVAYAVALHIGDVELKLWVVLHRVNVILLHQRIAQHQQVVVVGIDMECVGDGLLLAPDSPVAQPHREAVPCRNGVELVVRIGVALQRIGMHRVAGVGRQRTRIDNTHG